MTDRLKGVVVTFDRDIRADDAEPIIAALRQIRGVLTVEPVTANYEDHMNRDRVRREIQERLWKAFEEKRP